MSFLYPRKIRVLRPAAQRGLGASTGYGGQTRATDEEIAKDVPASIQLKGDAGRPQAQLPGDASRRTYWKILIPRDALQLGTVRLSDIIEDDMKVRYQVLAPYLNAFGHSLLCERMDL